MPEVQPRDILLRIGGRSLWRHGVVSIGGAGRGLAGLVETFTRASAQNTSDTYMDRDGVVRIAAANKLRIDYSPFYTGGLVFPDGSPACGLLLEGARTNPCLRSKEWDNAAWTLTNATVTPNATTAPDGTVTADKLVENAAVGALHGIHQAIGGLTDNTFYSWSAWVKAAERTWVRLRVTDKAANSNGSFFDLANGVWGTVNNTEKYLVQKAPGGWYRFAVAQDILSGGTTPQFGVFLATADNVGSYTGDGVSGVYVWGGQVEAGRFPSISTIHTDGAAKTRAADALSLLFNFGPFDLSVLARLLRPVHADTTAGASLGTVPGIFRLGGAQPQLIATYQQANRNVNGLVRTGTDAQKNVAIPAGLEQTYLYQFKDLALPVAAGGGGKAAIDVGDGSGLSTFSGANSTPFSAYGNQTLAVGIGGTAELFGVLIDLMFLRGLFSRSEALAIP